MNIIVAILLIILTWLLWLFLPSNEKFQNIDDSLVQNYYIKENFDKRVVIVIESFNSIEQLMDLIRNILKQDIKVDSIIIISQDKKLHNFKLIQDTCITNKVGGLSFLLKESNNNTIILFLFSEGFNAFNEPQFLNKFLVNGKNQNGIIMADTSTLKVELNRIYESNY